MLIARPPIRSPRLGQDEAGGVFIELAIVAPILILLGFTAFRLSVLTSSVPVVEGNVHAILQSLEGNSYASTTTGLQVDTAQVQANIDDVFTARAGSTKAARMLSLERMSHGAAMAAYSCACGGDCASTPLYSSSTSAGLGADLVQSEALIHDACVTLHDELKNSAACEGLPEQICYGIKVRFGFFLTTRELGAVFVDRPGENQRIGGAGASAWIGGGP